MILLKPKKKASGGRSKHGDAAKVKELKEKPSPLQAEGQLLTPNWFWKAYINEQIVPPAVAAPLVEVADPQLSSPLSNGSKLQLPTAGGSQSSCPPPPVLVPSEMDPEFADVLTISRQRRLRSMATTFSIEELLPPRKVKSSRSDQLPAALIEIVEEKPQIPQVAAPALDPMLTDAVVTAHDFELVWGTRLSCQDTSFAEATLRSADRKLRNYEIIHTAIRNCLLDDLEIQVESKFFHVDRYLFTYFARNFRACRGPFLQLPVQQVPMRLLTQIYEWMLQDEAGFPVGPDMIPFYKAARFLGVQRLEEQYWSTFSASGDRGVWELNAVHTYLQAREHRCPEIMAAMLSRVRKCFLPLVASLEFLEFEASEVACLLRQDMLCVNSEDEVLFACLHWLDFAWPERRRHALHLLSQVRFCFLSPWLRRSLANFPENALLREIAQMPQVARWLWQATKQTAAVVANRQREEQKGGLVQKMLAEYRGQRATERYWTFCRGVPHHHDAKCPRHRELTFGTFRLFLHRLHSQAQRFMDDLCFVPNKHWATYRCCVDVEYFPEAERTCPRPPIYTRLLSSKQLSPPD
ncbi:uncharacterized protein LOC108092935 [Drosophila ficusphila]|uniref:uncharacterized protein LOC108092935 n=1 Tax=Drosophila ficusphila TaxID=30025 RepID=UPI0007E6163F|nr:uncharacterized protein LOC108092935 [Drosophila ficusphila]